MVFETIDNYYNEQNPRLIRFLLDFKRHGRDIVADPRWNALVKKMGLPDNVSYSIQHKQSGKQLQDSDTLASAGVKTGDTLHLLPNITAGL